MAGRGRGRGRGSSFTADILGVGRGGESLPPPTAQPPPLFPPLELTSAPLPKSEENENMFLLKQELRSYMRESPYYIKPHNKKKDIERYSDKYQVSSGDQGIGWQPDWKRFPRELRLETRKARPVRPGAKPSLTSSRGRKKTSETEDVIKKLNELEKKEEGTKSGEEEEEEGEGEAEEDDEEYYDEEEQEEGTDYISNYFDPGDDYLDDDDGLDDGPTY